MATAYQFDGPCIIKVDTGTSNALETLGYSADGVRIAEQASFINVPTDEYAGGEGPPGDVQYVGALHQVRFTLTKFDLAILNKVRERVYGQTAGTIPDPGTFMSSNAFRLLLYPDDYGTGSNNPRNYLLAFPRGDLSFNKSVKYTAVDMLWECHAKDVSGTLTMWNTTDT